MTEIAAAGDSHVGQVRRGNEDSLHVGETVFAVADGMGGHVAGEVASETALQPVAELDGRVFADAEAATEALREAIRQANDAVLDRAEEDRELRGMGTTLTAALLEHRRLHIGHVGDSRAYLLRGGRLEQLTHDHTLVQDLVDDGQIDAQEAATHPQRSIITRAIGVARELEADLLTVDLRGGDRLLLCSDGLTGVIDDGEVAAALGDDDPDEAVAHLIDVANERGAPDNVTAVAMAFDDDTGRPAAAGATTGELTAVPVDGDAVRVSSRAEEDEEDDWAGELGRLGSLGHDRTERRFGDDDEGGAGILRKVLAVLLGLAVLLALVVGGGRWLVSRSYYVGLADREVAIYQGVPTDLGPIDLSWVHEETALHVEDVPEFYVRRLEEGIPAADLADARRIVDNAPSSEETDDDADGDGPDTASSPSPTTTPSPSPSPTPSPPPTTTP